MKTLHLSILMILILIFVIPIHNLASAQNPDVACGWHLRFDKPEFSETDVIPIKISDPCYPQEGNTITVTVSDGDTTEITGKYLNQTITATNSTVTIDFKKPTDSQQYRFLVALKFPPNTYQSWGVGEFIFIKPNASKLTIVDPFISSYNVDGHRVIHAKLIDGLGNPVVGAKWGVGIHVDLLIPQCDYGNNCLIPNLDLTPNPSNQTFDGVIDIPNDLASGIYHAVFTAKSYYGGYQVTSVDVPISVNNDGVNDASIPEFPFAMPILLIGIVSVIGFYRMKFRR